MNGLPVGSLAGVPITISFWYLIIVAWNGLQSGPEVGVLWFMVLTISLLVHEFGHAMFAKRYRLNPSVRLEIWGGSCAHERADSDAEDAMILIAGPAAGMLLGLTFWGVRWALVRFSVEAYLSSPVVILGLDFMIYVNVFWTLINVLPIWPLDGGRLFRLGLLRFMTPLKAERITHSVGIALALGLIGYALSVGFSRFAIVLGAVVAWMNFQALKGDRASGPIRGQSKFSKELLGEARSAFATGNWHEAARYCHQIRTEPHVPKRVLAEVWRILGLSTAQMGRAKEAVSYLRRADLDAEVAEVWLRSLAELDDREAVHDLLESQEWSRLKDADAVVARVFETAPEP
ncbi:MAG: Zn-dependent protease [Bradymonadia bacterium]|jgi:Zn-dependent protease